MPRDLHLEEQDGQVREFCRSVGMTVADLAWFMDHGPGTCTFTYQQDTARGHHASMVFGVQEYQTRPDHTEPDAGMERQQVGLEHDTNMDPAITMTPAGAVDSRVQSVGHGLCWVRGH